MKVFLDTSSLLKLYHREQGSEKLLEFISQNASQIFLSELAKVEFVSAIWKNVRMQLLPESVATQIISFFENDFDNFYWIKVDSKTLELAKELIKKIWKLRT